MVNTPFNIGGVGGADNVLQITVDGVTVYPTGSTPMLYVNRPWVSVTVCPPGTTTPNENVCRTVDKILLDTGSYGLRIFKTALSGVALTQVSSPDGGKLANCAWFGDESTLWGAVMTADVYLGGEVAVGIPIQVVDNSFGDYTQKCGSPDATPAVAGFNGILGVGLLAQDCGSGCDGSANKYNRVYYSVSTTGATTSTYAPISSQVVNPVAMLRADNGVLDNNGVIVQLPTVNPAGATSTSGLLFLGIGTRPNNTPSSSLPVTVYPANSSAEFQTIFSGQTFQSFLDTGSNALYFPSASMPTSGGWFTPQPFANLSAVNAGYNGSPSNKTYFTIYDANTLFTSPYMVFSTLGVNASINGGFDWGLPFFMGRSVYVGLDGTTSGLAPGPYWAY